MNTPAEPPAKPDGAIPQCTFISKVQEQVAALASGHRLTIAVAITVISSWSLVSALNAPIQGDLGFYESIANDLSNGKLSQRVFAYPPYAAAIFALPHWLGMNDYGESFMLLAILADSLVKLILFIIGFRHQNTARSVLPLLIYGAAAPFLRYFYLQRYDVWPALICLVAVWLFGSGRFLLCGIAISAGAGAKLYPIIFVPPLLVSAARQGKAGKFVTGLVLGALPMVALGFIAPWWRFAEFHIERGIQVESFFGSFLWLAKRLGWAQLNWTYTQSCWEVQGPLATAFLPWLRALFVILTAASIGFAGWAASRTEKLSAPRLARLLLIPLLGFVLFNQVFSPQYLIWLLPLAALGSLEGSSWTLALIPLAVGLTPLFYPVPQYFDAGLNLFQTIVLLLRNLILAAVWMLLIREWLLPAARDRRE